jgi:H+/gluconate symporter-like permease
MDALAKAFTMMGVALPTMFVVIAVFIFATKALHRAFPAPAEEEDADGEDD